MKEITYSMLERLTYINKKLAAGACVNKNQFAKELEASVSTIGRDIDYLRDRMLAPIEYDSSRKGYYYSDDFEMPSYKISEKDVQLLGCAQLFLSYFENTPIYKDASSIIDLLSCSVVKSSSSPLKNRILLAPSAKSVVDASLWEELCSAMKDNRIVEFEYTGRWHNDCPHRRVHPYQVVLDNSQCYLFGYSEERKATRLFSLTRIRKLEITNDTFKLPKNFDFKQLCGGGKFGAFSNGKEEKCTIEFYRSAREMVKDCLWADDQKIVEDTNKNCTRISFSSAQTPKVLEWILSQGANARPLEPKSLVDQWKKTILQLNEMVKG